MKGLAIGAAIALIALVLYRPGIANNLYFVPDLLISLVFTGAYARDTLKRLFTTGFDGFRNTLKSALDLLALAVIALFVIDTAVLRLILKIDLPFTSDSSTMLILVTILVVVSALVDPAFPHTIHASHVSHRRSGSLLRTFIVAVCGILLFFALIMLMPHILRLLDK